MTPTPTTPNPVLRCGRAIGALLASLWLVACSTADRGEGAACIASAECKAGLCYANKCLAPSGDPDVDGLSNSVEHALHSHPLRADSDGDGKPDGVEVGADPSQPVDTDGDGKPDVLESLLADHDHDCLVDERDPADGVADATPAQWATLACAVDGACHVQPIKTLASCTLGKLSCDYSLVPGWSAVEQCDGIDNDCNGQIDEGFAYAGVAVGKSCVGRGACGPGVVECQGGLAICSVNPGGSASLASAELCNGKDDDCDGEIDEDFKLGGLPIGSPCVGTGQCGLGKIVCGAGQPVCSSDPAGPASQAAPELCNGKDDDCDGQTDEGIALGSLTLGAVCVAPGVCGAGKVVCGAQNAVVCSSAPGSADSSAAPEQCNGLDDNCDGLTDEDLKLAGVALGAACPGQGACGAGIVACGKSGGVTCSTWPDGGDSQAKTESCNGLDDNCDGKTDENFHWQGLGLGEPCAGTGECGNGIVQCNKAGKTTCSSNADGSTPQALAEQCNGMDDDCDGQSDEGLPAPANLACPSAGVCLTAIPMPVCSGGGWICNFAAASGWQQAETTCDGLDNDCDGQTDEGLPHAWTGPQAAADGLPGPRQDPAVCAGAAGLLAAGGTVSALGSQTTVLANDLWRLDLTSGQWKRLATDPALQRRKAGALYLASGLVAPGARLWLLGGRDAQDQPGAAVEYDFLTGKIAALPFGQPPLPRDDATPVLLAQAKQVWLLGGTAKGGPAAQRLVLGAGAWTADVPQPPASSGHIAACATAAGTLFGLGAGDGTGWFAALTDAKAWQSLSVPAGLGPIDGARLVCDPVPGEVWLLGAADGSGKSLPILRFAVATGIWQTKDDGAWPGLTGPAVAALPGGGVAVALGLAEDGLPQNHAWSGQPGAWKLLDAAPGPVLGARWVTVGADIYRVGGASLHGPGASFTSPSWRLHAGKWQPLPMPDGTSGRAFAAIALEPGDAGILVWSGVGKAVPATSLLGQEIQPGAPGGMRLDLQTGTWSALTGQKLAMLPAVPADAPMASLPGVTYILNAGAKVDSAELWRVDLVKSAKVQLWQSADSPGPAFRPGAAMTMDPAANRIVLVQTDGNNLQVWTFSSSGAEAWQLAAQEPLVGNARVALLGGPDADSRLLLITRSPGAGKAMIRTLQLGPKPTLLVMTVDAPAWWGPVSGAWLPWASQVLVDGRLDADGVPRSGLEQYLLTCP